MPASDNYNTEATEATTWLGDKIAEAGHVAGPVGDAVAAAASVGVHIGEYINEHTDITDKGSDGLMWLVGDEESYKASQAWDDGDYLGTAGHMLKGAGEHLYDAAGDAVDAVGDAVSDAADAVGDAVGDAIDFLNPFD